MVNTNKGQGNNPAPPVIDPTANVLGLVAAANLRQDDLRQAEAKRLDEIHELTNIYEHELRKVRAEAAADLSAAESRRIDALAVAESRRLDAVLAEQKNAVALANEKNAAAASALATQVVASAEALRTQVATTAAANAALIAELRTTMDKRLTEVERKQYEAAGQAAQRVEGRQGVRWSIGTIVGMVGMLIALVALASRLLGH
jgi:hypothetical protein